MTRAANAMVSDEIAEEQSENPHQTTVSVFNAQSNGSLNMTSVCIPQKGDYIAQIAEGPVYPHRDALDEKQGALFDRLISARTPFSVVTCRNATGRSIYEADTTAIHIVPRNQHQIIIRAMDEFKPYVNN